MDILRRQVEQSYSPLQEIQPPFIENVRPHRFMHVFRTVSEQWPFYVGAATEEEIAASIEDTAQYFVEKAELYGNTSYQHNVVASRGIAFARRHAAEVIALAQRVMHMDPQAILKISAQNDSVCETCAIGRHCRSLWDLFHDYDIYESLHPERSKDEIERSELDTIIDRLESLGFVEGVHFVIRVEPVQYMVQRKTAQKNLFHRTRRTETEEWVTVQSPALYVFGFPIQQVARSFALPFSKRTKWTL